MAFVYLLLSLIASIVQEIFAAIIQSRAANLQRGLRSMFSGDSIEAGKTLVDSIYNHGLVRGLYQDPARDFGVKTAQSTVRLGLQKWVGIAPPQQIKGVSDPLLLPAYIPARTFALAMVDLLNTDKVNGNPVANIEKFLNDPNQNWTDNKAVEALRSLVIDSSGNLDRLKTNLENWYSDAMDRVSGWYKKFTQKFLLIIGLALAIAFNVNSIRVAHTLWLDKDARQGMANAASEYLKSKNAASQGSGKDATPGKNAASNCTQSKDTALCLKDQMQDTVDAFNRVTTDTLLPVGWHTREQYAQALSVQRGSTNFLKILQVLLGWLITALAISLGAPFWFDILNKFMVVRSTVKPEEKSQPEASKD
jgi:hypothetical protein